jgi:hypothetical protein
MTTIMLLFSFILNAISLFLIIILFIRYSHLSKLEKKQEKMMNEMESVMTSFLLEMKEENEMFLQKLQKKQTEQKSETKKLNQQRSSARKEYTHPPIEQVKDIVEISSSKTIVSERSLPEKEAKIGPKETVDPMETLLAQVQILQNEGLSIEEIAKKLNKGKTEIELLLKFRQRT